MPEAVWVGSEGKAFQSDSLWKSQKYSTLFVSTLQGLRSQVLFHLARWFHHVLYRCMCKRGIDTLATGTPSASARQDEMRMRNESEKYKTDFVRGLAK